MNMTAIEINFCIFSSVFLSEPPQPQKSVDLFCELEQGLPSSGIGLTLLD